MLFFVCDLQILASVDAVENASTMDLIRFGVTDLHQIRVYEANRHLGMIIP